MIDKAIGAGAMFDWITPLWTFVQDWRYRPSCGYSVPVDGGYSLYGIKGLLSDKGVLTWGWAIVDGVILFRARVAQAEYAQYWLTRWGVVYSGGVKAPRTRQQRGGLLGLIARLGGG
jgi:hypothetical protein